MVIAAAIAIAARVNLPISVCLVWITNPVTMPAMFYFAYRVGIWILGTPAREFNFELSFEWLMVELGQIWQPFLLGCLVLGLASSLAAYLLTRLFWRFHIFQYIKKRRLRRKARKQSLGGN